MMWIRSKRLLFGLMGLALTGAAPRGVGAQEFQIDQVHHVSASGTSESGSFALYSAVGSADPTGTTSGGSYTLTSASQALLSSVGEAAVVGHVPTEVVDGGADLVVVCDVDIPGRVRDVELFYRRGGSTEYSILPMADDDDDQRYVATIPGTDVTSEGLGYFFVARNSAGRSYRSPVSGVYSVGVRIPEAGLESPDMLPGGTDQTGYRLISVPLDLEDKTPSTVLEDDLGTYDPESWRFFELLFDQSLREYPGTVPMTPGKAFWLIVREEGKVFDTGPGSALAIDHPRRVAVHSGWNLVGNPFHFDLPVENVRLAGSDELQIRSYEGAWNDPLNDPVTELSPFSGYAVFNAQPDVDTLYFDPELPSAEGSARVFEAAATSSKSRLEWSIHISAISGTARDTDNYAGVSKQSQAGPDHLDFAEPPTVGPSVSVYFPHSEWDLPAANFATDIRAPGNEIETWILEVEATTKQPIDLHFGGMDTMPQDLQVLLVDEIAGGSQDLRRVDRYTLSAARNGRRLRLIVGSGDAMQALLAEWIELPERLTIEPVFPNPFHSSATISFGLPEPAHVSIEVYDVTGKRVATLIDEHRSEGFHSFVWDGRAGSGIPLPSGLYILHLRSGGASMSQRVTIIR